MAVLAEPPLVMFAPAAGQGVGGGHVMRCLSLAAALVESGARCVFAVPEPGRRIVERFATAPVETVALQRSGDVVRLAELRAVREPAAVVIDDYRFDLSSELAVTGGEGTLVVLDDLANRLHLADVLIDPGYGRKTGDYVRLIPPGGELLLGPEYALIRPAIVACRAAAPRIRRGVERVFISFGLSDVGSIAAEAVNLLRPLAPGVRFDVALASDAESLPALRRRAETDQDLHLHVDAPEVAELMAQADVAVGAGGSSTWERCCLGLPTLAVVLAENQRAMIQTMAADGVLLAVDRADPEFPRKLVSEFEQLVKESAVRAELAETSAGLCDGLGAERAAATILNRIRSQAG